MKRSVRPSSSVFRALRESRAAWRSQHLLIRIGNALVGGDGFQLDADEREARRPKTAAERIDFPENASNVAVMMARGHWLRARGPLRQFNQDALDAELPAYLLKTLSLR